MRDEHVVATPRVQRLSFRATGTPASGPGSTPAATCRSTSSAAASASSISTLLNACSAPSPDSTSDSASSTTSRAPRSPDRTEAATARAVTATAPHPFGREIGCADNQLRAQNGKGSSGFAQDAGDAKAAVLGGRRLGEHLVAVEALVGDVVAQDVGERQRVGGGRHARGVEGGDVGRVLEDGAQLLGEPLELVVGDVEAGEPRHVGDVVSR